MKRLLACLAILIGCSSTSSDDGTRATGVSCNVTDRICCQVDYATKPTCVLGEWRCPIGFDRFVTSDQCGYGPSSYDSGTFDTGLDDTATFDTSTADTNAEGSPCGDGDACGADASDG